MKESAALVTGATGYIGLHLLRQLLEGGWKHQYSLPEMVDSFLKEKSVCV